MVMNVCVKFDLLFVIFFVTIITCTSTITSFSSNIIFLNYSIMKPIVTSSSRSGSFSCWSGQWASSWSKIYTVYNKTCKKRDISSSSSSSSLSGEAATIVIVLIIITIIITSTIITITVINIITAIITKSDNERVLKGTFFRRRLYHHHHNQSHCRHYQLQQ